MEQSDIEKEVRARAQRDADFRARLIEDPHAALAESHGLDIPSELRIRVVEEADDEFVLVLPPARAGVEELADEELELSSGAGTKWGDSTCGSTCANSCTCSHCP